MLFNSYEFILLYIPVVFIFYFLIANRYNKTHAKWFLVFSSLVFYSYWDINNLPILLFSIIVNYILGDQLNKNRSRLLLVIGIAFNMFYLGFFKYTDFIIENLNLLFSLNVPMYHVVLPLGISFFSFTQTAYLVDIYRGEISKYSKCNYLLFVTIFPHLIAGPILYHKDIIPQFDRDENFKINYRNIYYGILWFTIGLFKKLVIADNLAEWADKVFTNYTVINTIDAWFGSFAYTLQLYYDFCGYSEMAIGLGLLFNYNLPLNFNLPYRACSIIDFWRRWHITLSAFLKNYLYIPLGGNRNGHHLRNIFITMFLGGLWHGAGWTFIIWGAFHGLCICCNHIWRKFKIELPNIVGWFITINVVNIAWVFFRASSIEQALVILRKMFYFNEYSVLYDDSFASLLVILFNNDSLITSAQCIRIFGFLLLSLLVLNKNKIENYSVYFISSINAMIFVYLILRLSSISEFLYFQF